MKLEEYDRFIYVVGNENKFFAHISIDNFTNISVKPLSQSLFGKSFDYGIVINFGGIEYCINFMLESKRYGFDFYSVGVKFDRLATHITTGLHCILNEKGDVLDYWTDSKRKAMKRMSGILTLDIDKFIYNIIYTNSDILDIPTSGLKNKNRNKNREKKGDKYGYENE